MYRPGEPLPRRKYGLHRILWLIPRRVLIAGRSTGKSHYKND